MADLYTLSHGQRDYRAIVEAVRHDGEHRSPRGQLTHDLGNVTLFFEDADRNMLPTRVGRRLNRGIAAVEALQLIGGVSTPDLLVRVAPQFRQFAEPSGQFWGAYGQRIGGQLEQVVRKLQADLDTRQAVLTLWDPRYDNTPGKRDYPCTVTLGFSVYRRRNLDLNVTMRSNDVWLGLPYDLFQFNQLQHTVATLLSLEVGEYNHTAWSLHLYDRDYAAAEIQLHELAQSDYQPSGLGLRDVATTQVVAWLLLNGETPETHELLRDPGLDARAVSWYADALAQSQA